MKKGFLVLFVLLTVCAGFVSAEGQQDSADDEGFRIVLCNNYSGNTWRQAMVESWIRAGEEAEAKGLVSEVDVITTSENSPAAQVEEIQNLILQGYDAIVINAASGTALNGAVKEARDAGIIVVSFDNTVTYEDSWRLDTDFPGMGYAQVKYLAERYGEKAINVIEIRGMAGTSADDAIHSGIARGLEEFKNINLVGSVYGNWTSTVAQKEVAGILPPLPDITAVLTQGGDGFGAIKAFEAVGREVPVVIMGNRYDELRMWKELETKTGYETMSIAAVPSSAQIAFWTAIEILSGNDVPKQMKIPTFGFTKEDLDYQLASTPEGSVANLDYPQQWVQQLIENTKAGKSAPESP